MNRSETRDMWERQGRRNVCEKIMEVIDALTKVRDTISMTDAQILEIVRTYAMRQLDKLEGNF